MNGLKKLNDLLFPGAKTYERVGAGKAVALGFQHAFAMSCATILVPLLTGLDVGRGPAGRRPWHAGVPPVHRR